MTNGDKVLANFPKATIRTWNKGGFAYIEVERDDSWIADFNIEWWNSECEAESEE